MPILCFRTALPSFFPGLPDRMPESSIGDCRSSFAVMFLPRSRHAIPQRVPARTGRSEWRILDDHLSLYFWNVRFYFRLHHIYVHPERTGVEYKHLSAIGFASNKLRLSVTRCERSQV